MNISTTLDNVVSNFVGFIKIGTGKVESLYGVKIPKKLSGLISKFGDNGKKDNHEVYSFSDELYRRFNDPEENKALEDFLTEKRELTKFENGIEKKIKFGILGNLSDDDTKNVSLEEIKEFMKFVHLYGKARHEGHKRRSGKDYDEHPIAATINLAKYKVSYKALDAERLHDIVEERIKREIKKDDLYKALKIKKIFYSIGLELYNFVKNNSKIKNKERFYRDINIIMRIIANMSNVEGKSHINYLLNQIFYAKFPDIRSGIMIGSPEDVLPLLKRERFYGVNDNIELVGGYMRDVHGVVLRDRSLMDEPSKIKRRTIMCKLSDMTVNLEDMIPDYEDTVNGLPIQFRAWEYFKGLLITNETGIKQNRVHQGKYLNRIMNQGAELRARFLKEIDKDIKYLEGSELLSNNYIGFVNHFLDAYKKRPGAISGLTRSNKKENIEAAFKAYKEWKRTGKEIDRKHYFRGNPFDGTLIRYILMMFEGKEQPLKEFSYEGIYKDLLLLRQVTLRMNEIYKETGKQLTIKRFGLNNMVVNYEKLKASLSPN